MLAHPVVVAVTPALVVGLVESGLDRLDFACVVFDVQRGSADGGVGVFLEPFHLAAEALVERESGAARADGMQRPDPGLRVGGAEPGSWPRPGGARCAACSPAPGCPECGVMTGRTGSSPMPGGASRTSAWPWPG